MNGRGGWVPLRVGLNDINAYYDGTQVQIGKNTAGQWISSLDVVAHEYGHGVDDTTPGGISQAGTQEFVGDVFGDADRVLRQPVRVVRRARLPVGEEINLVGQGPIRDMDNPAAVGDPELLLQLASRPPRCTRPPARQPLVLPAAEGSSPATASRQATCNSHGHRHRHPERRQDHVQRDADEDVLVVLPEVPHLDADRGQEPRPGSCAQFNAVKAAWDAVSVPAQTADPTCGGTTRPPRPPAATCSPTRASSPAPRRGPAPPASSPPTPAARPAPAPTRRGSAATAPPRPRR